MDDLTAIASEGSVLLILITSIFCSVAVSVLLKIARQHQIDVAQAIAVNYPVAALLCWLLLNPQPASLLTPSPVWWILGALGVLLPSVFLIMAGAVRYAGIVRSDAAQRLSLLIPLLAAFLLFGEALNPMKLLGIGVALTALLCLLKRRTSVERAAQAPSRWIVPLLLGVWIGYGVIDILFKQMAKTGAAFASILFTTFVLAAILIFAHPVDGAQPFGRRGAGFVELWQYLLLHPRPPGVFREPNAGVFGHEYWCDFARDPGRCRSVQGKTVMGERAGHWLGHRCHCDSVSPLMLGRRRLITRLAWTRHLLRG